MSPIKLVSRGLLTAAGLCLVICIVQYLRSDPDDISVETIYRAGSIIPWLALGVIFYIISVIVGLCAPKGPPPLPPRKPKGPLTREELEQLIIAAKPVDHQPTPPPPLDRPPTYKLD